MSQELSQEKRYRSQIQEDHKEDHNTAPDSPPHVVSQSYELIKLSPFEERVQKIFIGPDGLRPLWRLVLYVILYRALRLAVRLLIYYGLPDMGDLRLQAVAYAGLAIAAIAAALVMGRIENRPFGTYGLPLRSAFGKMFWLGSLWGFGSLTCYCWLCVEPVPLTSGCSPCTAHAR